MDPNNHSENSGGIPPLLPILRKELDANIGGGIYHELQITLTYHSNCRDGQDRVKELIGRFRIPMFGGTINLG
ncbi:hypothetical protein TALC_01404 [Thermoplasmatales archaeon BRNA1]|nr:hypothetical protein TALC_01404 [Thermoplasmatales archaeon BRNA1]